MQMNSVLPHVLVSNALNVFVFARNEAEEDDDKCIVLALH